MLLDSWVGVARGMMDEKTWAWIPIVAWCIISGFVVANLFIAVICESLMKLDEIEKKKVQDDINRASMQGRTIDIEKLKADSMDKGSSALLRSVYMTTLLDDISRLKYQQEKLLTVLKTFPPQSDKSLERFKSFGDASSIFVSPEESNKSLYGRSKSIGDASSVFVPPKNGP